MCTYGRTFKPHDPIQAWLETRTQTERDILTKTPAAFAVDVARIQLRRAKHPGDFIDLGPPEEGSMERAEATAIATAEGGLFAFRSGALRTWARGERTPWTLGHEAPTGVYPFLPPSFMCETEGAPITAILVRGPSEGMGPGTATEHRDNFDLRGLRGTSPEEMERVLKTNRRRQTNALILSICRKPYRRGPLAAKVQAWKCDIYDEAPLSISDPWAGITYNDRLLLEDEPTFLHERLITERDESYYQSTRNAYLIEIIERVELP